MRAICLSIAIAIAVSAGTAPARQSDQMLSGRYEFRPTVIGPKGPLCREVWNFDAQVGTLTVESGTEVALKRFRLEEETGDVRLVTNLIATNGGANCSGSVRDPNDHSDHAVYLLNGPRGGIAICPEPVWSDNGTAPLYGGCYGEITKLPQRP